MDGRDGLPDRVKEQNRRTVRREADERHARLVGEDAVADSGLLPVKAGAAVGSAHAQQKVGVLLPGEDGLLRRKADGFARP